MIDMFNLENEVKEAKDDWSVADVSTNTAMHHLLNIFHLSTKFELGTVQLNSAFLFCSTWSPFRTYLGWPILQ